jgi:hypothetical protein
VTGLPYAANIWVVLFHSDEFLGFFGFAGSGFVERGQIKMMIF